MFETSEVWLFVVAVVGGVGYLPDRVVRHAADRVPDPVLEELRDASDCEDGSSRHELSRQSVADRCRLYPS